jgi:hypothetical protein
MFPSTSNFGENIILITGKDYNTGEQRSYIYKETTGTMEELSNNPNYAYRPGVCSFTHDAGAETVYRIALIGGTDKSGNYVKLNQFMTDIENISDIFSPLSGIARNVDNSLIGVKKNDVITPSGSGTIIFIGTDSEM